MSVAINLKKENLQNFIAKAELLFNFLGFEANKPSVNINFLLGKIFQANKDQIQSFKTHMGIKPLAKKRFIKRFARPNRQLEKARTVLIVKMKNLQAIFSILTLHPVNIVKLPMNFPVDSFFSKVFKLDLAQFKEVKKVLKFTKEKLSPDQIKDVKIVIDNIGMFEEKRRELPKQKKTSSLEVSLKPKPPKALGKTSKEPPKNLKKEKTSLNKAIEPNKNPQKKIETENEFGSWVIIN